MELDKRFKLAVINSFRRLKIDMDLMKKDLEMLKGFQKEVDVIKNKLETLKKQNKKGFKHLPKRIKKLIRSRDKVCVNCGKTADQERLVVHHKDKNPTNNIIENLELLCITCHNRLHAGIDITKKKDIFFKQEPSKELDKAYSEIVDKVAKEIMGEPSKKLDTSKQVDKMIPMDSLTNKERKIIMVLFDNKGTELSYDDLSKLLDKTPSTLRSQINIIKKRTKLLIETIDPEGKKRYRLKDGIKLQSFLQPT